MAFPTFVAAPTTSTGVGTSAAVTTPATNDGELLIILIATDGDNTFDWTGSNATEIVEGADAKDIATSAAYRYDVTGQSAGSETVTLGSNERWAALCYRVTAGTHNGDTDPPEASTVATGAGTAAQANTCTPTGGAKDYLWLTWHGLDNDSGAGATPPSGYGNFQYHDSAAPGACSISAADRTNNAASESAGTWTNSSDQWAAATLAIHPYVDVPETFNRTLSDDLTLTDTISRDAVNTRGLSDALTLSENLQRAKIANYTISDSLSLTEQMELHFVRYRILSDALTLTENLTRDAVYTRDLLDSLALTDNLSRHAVNARTLSDALALTDSIARDVVNVRILTDSLTLTDSLFRDVVSAPTAGQTSYGIRRRAGRM